MTTATSSVAEPPVGRTMPPQLKRRADAVADQIHRLGDRECPCVRDDDSPGAAPWPTVGARCGPRWILMANDHTDAADMRADPRAAMRRPMTWPVELAKVGSVGDITVARVLLSQCQGAPMP
jgi:hypothetical protein